MKILSLNCHSIRSLNKRNQFAAILDLNDIDIVLGTESHLDPIFLSSEILPPTYKLLRKDCCLGGGGVFIAFKHHLHILEESSLSMQNEMLWAKLIVGPNHDYYYFVLSTDHRIQILNQLLNYSNPLLYCCKTNPMTVIFSVW